MKLLQVMLPDEVFDSLEKEAKRAGGTVAGVVQRGIEHELRAAEGGLVPAPTIRPVSLGAPKVPVSEWREAANDRYGAE